MLETTRVCVVVETGSAFVVPVDVVSDGAVSWFCVTTGVALPDCCSNADIRLELPAAERLSKTEIMVGPEELSFSISKSELEESAIDIDMGGGSGKTGPDGKGSPAE